MMTTIKKQRRPVIKDKNHRPDKVRPNMWYVRWDNRLLGCMINLKLWFPSYWDAKNHINKTYFFRRFKPIIGKALLVDPNRYFLHYKE